MSVISNRTATCFILVALLHAAPLSAQGNFHSDTTDDLWQFRLAGWFWLPNVDSTVQLGPVESDLESDFGDLVDDYTVWGATGRLEARRQRVALFIEGLHSSLEKEDTFSAGPISASVEGDFELTAIDIGGSYQLLHHRFGDGPDLSIDGLAGGRYIKFESSLETAGPFGITQSVGGDSDWVEPFVGSTATLELSDSLALRAYGDVGGFDVGESDLTWKARILLDWQVSSGIAIIAGYQIFSLDFEDGQGFDRIGFDGRFQGPILGLAFRF